MKKKKKIVKDLKIEPFIKLFIDNRSQNYNFL